MLEFLADLPGNLDLLVLVVFVAVPARPGRFGMFFVGEMTVPEGGQIVWNGIVPGVRGLNQPVAGTRRLRPRIVQKAILQEDLQSAPTLSYNMFLSC